MDSSPAITSSPELPSQPAALPRWKKACLQLRGAPLIPMLILLLLVLTAIFADLWAPHNATVGNLRTRYRPPAWQEGGSAEFFLGTDHMGRDVLSRIIHGSRISLLVATAAVLVAGIIGTVLGILSGFYGGWVD